MLSRRLLPRRARAFWIPFLVLSPAAFILGGMLVSRYDPISLAGFTYDRSGLTELGTRLAVERGVNVTGWSPFLKGGWDNSRLFYYRVKPGGGTERLRQIVPPAWVRVLFRAPGAVENVEMTLTPQGRLISLRHSSPPSPNAIDEGQSQARQVAESTLTMWLLPEERARASTPELKEDRAGSAVTRTFKWKIPVDDRPELNLSYSTSVLGGRVMAQGFEASLSETFLRQYSLFGGFSLRVSGTRVLGIAAINLILYYLAIAVVFVFGLYRFVQRARQRELSYRRISVLTVIIAILFLSIILLTDIATFDNAGQRSAPIWPIYVFGVLSYLFMGLIVAAAYGSGEGDLREAYPGKLTSLDALLTGRIFSRNVARSVVIGSAFAGWILLGRNLVPFFWRNQPEAGRQIEMLDFIVGRVPWVSPLVLWPFDVVFTSIIGLLLPLPFVSRRFRNPKLIIACLSVFAWIASTGAATSFTPWSGAAIIGAVSAAALLVPFFKFDLLTALVSLAVPTYATAAMHLVAQPSSGLRQAGIVSFGIGLLFLIAQLWFSARGTLLREDEVGPQYARFLAERLSMQAEVSAAREAQVRLLPQTLPQSRHFSIAAECRPAHEVGGDFYEVFELDDDRIGIFMAEGGGKGLASALSIAFAKGFLLPKINNSGQTDDSPAEIVRSLQYRLRVTLDSASNMGVLYAVIDASDKTLRYARTGDYPRLIVGRKDGPTGNEIAREATESETVFTVKPRSASGTDETFTVVSGMSDVETDDFVVLFTDGIASVFADGKSSSIDGLWKDISQGRLDSPAALQRALHQTIESTNKRAQRSGLKDDLTTLVVRLNAS